MSAQVVRFPAGRIVRTRYYRVADCPERGEIDAALDSIRGAKVALRNQEKSVLAQLWHLIDRQLAEEGRPPLFNQPDGGAA